MTTVASLVHDSGALGRLNTFRAEGPHFVAHWTCNGDSLSPLTNPLTFNLDTTYIDEAMGVRFHRLSHRVRRRRWHQKDWQHRHPKPHASNVEGTAPLLSFVLPRCSF